LKAEGAVAGGTVEQAITSDPNLALLADLANLDKHFKLSRAPRSGDVPTITVKGVQPGSGEGGWRLEATIAPRSAPRRVGNRAVRARGVALAPYELGFGLTLRKSRRSAHGRRANGLRARGVGPRSVTRFVTRAER
jgi:hypothetical protein